MLLRGLPVFIIAGWFSAAVSAAPGASGPHDLNGPKAEKKVPAVQLANPNHPVVEEETDEELVQRAPGRVQTFWEKQQEKDKDRPENERAIRIGDTVHFLCDEGTCTYDGFQFIVSDVDLKSIRPFKECSLGIEDGNLKFRWKTGPWRDVHGGEDLKCVEAGPHVIYGLGNNGRIFGYFNTAEKLEGHGTNGVVIKDPATGVLKVKYYPLFNKQELQLAPTVITDVEEIRPSKFSKEEMILVFKNGDRVKFSKVDVYLKKKEAEEAKAAAEQAKD